MKTEKRGGRIGKKLFQLLPRNRICFDPADLAVSAVLNQITPLAIGYLTDHVLEGPAEGFLSVFPILGGILLVNVINEVLKVARRLMVEGCGHYRAMAFYDCLKFINEAVFSVLVIGISVFLASQTDYYSGYGADCLPVFYPAYRAAAGTSPYTGRIFGVCGSGGRLFQ